MINNLSSVEFHKYHGLGNDYIVVREADLPQPLIPAQMIRICDRHYGFGADGIALDCSDENGFALRIFNPDGSEAEKSGNALRIFARYLWDAGRVHSEAFRIHTKGGEVEAQVLDEAQHITVMMGRASFDSREIPVDGPQREVINETIEIGLMQSPQPPNSGGSSRIPPKVGGLGGRLRNSYEIDGQELTYCAVTLGNPHCVILRDKISAEEAKKWGPLIENELRFPNRTNVQFMKVLDRANIQIEIWERGAGYTLASGSSSCAAAAVAYRLGLCDANITVHMPGGEIEIAIDEDFHVSMTGPVSKVWQGYLSKEVFENPY